MKFMQVASFQNESPKKLEEQINEFLLKAVDMNDEIINTYFSYDNNKHTCFITFLVEASLSNRVVSKKK